MEKLKREVSGLFWENLTGEKKSVIEVTEEESHSIDHDSVSQVMLLLTEIYLKGLNKPKTSI